MGEPERRDNADLARAIDGVAVSLAFIAAFIGLDSDNVIANIGGVVVLVFVLVYIFAAKR